MELNKYEKIILYAIYIIILIDILLSGIMLDLVALLMGIALYLYSIKIKSLKNIFFFSAIFFLLVAIVFYLIDSQYLPYNSAANWSYLFFLFGILKMFSELVFQKKS